MRSEMNKEPSFSGAARKGFSIETDLRDARKAITISHDPVDEDGLDVTRIFNLNCRFALNIKSDGLFELFQKSFFEFLNLTDSFFFDGSVPQMLQYKKKGLKTALRLSEFETNLPWHTPFIWVDSFEEDWWIKSNYIESLAMERQLIFVSPEIHGRENLFAWDEILRLDLKYPGMINICTDLPSKFVSYAQIGLEGKNDN